MEAKQRGQSRRQWRQRACYLKVHFRNRVVVLGSLTAGSLRVEPSQFFMCAQSAFYDNFLRVTDIAYWSLIDSPLIPRRNLKGSGKPGSIHGLSTGPVFAGLVMEQ